MTEEKRKQMVEEAYTTLKNIAELNIHITGGYFELIFANKKEGQEEADQIINELFWKFCNELFFKKGKKVPKTIVYHSFTFINTSDSLLNDCHQIIRKQIDKKKRNTDTLYSLLNPLTNKYPKEEVEKALDTIFNILLSYYVAQ
jgi:hypothetical protein